MSYIETKRNISKNKIFPLYLLIGEERFLVEDLIQSIVAQTLTEEEYDFNLSTYELKETPIDVAIEDANTLPFLGSKRVVIAKDAYFLTAQKDDSKIEHNLKLFEAYVQNPVIETVFILTAPFDKLDERKKLVKSLRKQSEIVDTKEFDEKMLHEWLNEQADSHSIEFTKGGKEKLIQLLGGNLLMLVNEIEKLSLYVGEHGTVDEEIVDQLVAKTVEQDVFMLIDHLIHKRIEKALEIYFDLMRQKEDPIKLVALLARQVRIIYQVKELMKRGYSQQQIAGQIKIHPYVAKLAGQQAKAFQEATLFRLLERLAETDFHIKSGQVDKHLAIELLLMEFHR
ncbi:DNA polymerase III subunit delta [Alkalihalobacterium alkalinitrilicum]|uniref:DNA polymerase III subunit delta n=1 Tax=Alkalihalobacterium alkalinitrilicum TaxID=427920 RepID=UPI0009953860|nr:DNA polymerase III subunit delta [Alkalihalobacterium alkalinitrilicum]